MKVFVVALAFGLVLSAAPSFAQAQAPAQPAPGTVKPSPPAPGTVKPPPAAPVTQPAAPKVPFQTGLKYAFIVPRHAPLCRQRTEPGTSSISR